MLLEFKLLKINEENKFFKKISKFNKNNEFIMVGKEKVEGKEHLKVIQLTETGIKLIGGLKINELSLSMPKEEFRLANDGIGVDYSEFEIPKEYLTLEIIENIQRLNS